ncbi:MAG: nucleotide exchange factor GrpE [Desulfobacterales bacterium]|nr:MAG: nucleotide exchange factor GrpE [Desulfobacterales bacterium]
MVTKKRVVVQQETKEEKPEDLTPQNTEDAGGEATSFQENEKNKEEQEEALDPITEMEAKLESLEQESKETHDRLLRVSAEFENYKKRAAREMADFRKFANESFVKAILPVVDNLDRAIESSSNDEHPNSSVVEGVSMTLKEILRVLEQFSVKPFESVGKTFDPGFHQAMHQEETEEYPDNTVVSEFQKEKRK